MAKRLETSKDMLLNFDYSQVKQSAMTFSPTKRKMHEEPNAFVERSISEYAGAVENGERQKEQALREIKTLEAERSSDPSAYLRENTYYVPQISGWESFYNSAEATIEKYRSAIQHLEEFKINPPVEQKAPTNPQQMFPGSQGPAIIEPNIQKVRNPDIQEEEERKRWVDPSKKNLPAARKKLREKIQTTMEALKKSDEPNWMNDDVIADAVLNDPESRTILDAFNFSVDVIDEDAPLIKGRGGQPDQPTFMKSVDPEDVEDQERREILKQIKEVNKPKVNELFDKPVASRLQSWVSSPNIDIRTMDQDEFVDASEDEDYQEYRNGIKEQLKTENGLKRASSAYNNYKINLEKEFEKQKKEFPSFEEWVENVYVLPYYDWKYKDDEGFQQARSNEREIATQVKKKELTPKEEFNLNSHLNASWYDSFQEDQNGDRGGPTGIRDPYAQKKYINDFPLMADTYQNVEDTLREQNPEMPQESIDQFAKLVYDGAIENLMEDMLYTDSSLKGLLVKAGVRTNEELGLAPKRDKGVTQQIHNKELVDATAAEVWDYIKTANLKGNSDSWEYRRKALTSEVLQQMAQENKINPESESDKKKLGVEVMRKFLQKSILNFMRRHNQTQGRKRKTEENQGFSESPFGFIDDMSSRGVDDLTEGLIDGSSPSEDQEPILTEGDIDSETLNLQQQLQQAIDDGNKNQVDELSNAINDLQEKQNRVVEVAPVALADASTQVKKMFELLYNKNSEFYRGNEVEFLGKSDDNKSWDKIAELWIDAYGNWDGFRLGPGQPRPGDETLKKVWGTMTGLIKGFIEKEDQEEINAEKKQDLENQKRTPADALAPREDATNAMPDTKTSPTNVKRQQEKKKNVDRALKTFAMRNRIAKIRALLKV